MVFILIKTIAPLLFLSLSRRKGEAYPGIRNWLTGKDSPSLVSEIASTSMIPLIRSASKSNLFLNELIRFFLRISFKFSSYEPVESSLRFLDLYSSKLSVKQLKLTFSQYFDSKYLRRFCVNTELPLLLR